MAGYPQHDIQALEQAYNRLFDREKQTPFAQALASFDTRSAVRAARRLVPAEVHDPFARMHLDLPALPLHSDDIPHGGQQPPVFQRLEHSPPQRCLPRPGTPRTMVRPQHRELLSRRAQTIPAPGHPTRMYRRRCLCERS
jgi:hypothetical protein